MNADPSAGLASRNAAQCGTNEGATRKPDVAESDKCVRKRRDLIAVNAKKIAMLAGVALVLFYVIAQPEGAAGLVGSIVGFLRSAAESVITFVQGVFS